MIVFDQALKAAIRKGLLEGLALCFVSDCVDAGFKNRNRRQAIKAIEEIGGIEKFNELAPRLAAARMAAGYRFIPRVINIDLEWWNRRLRARRFLGKEDYSDIVNTCHGIKNAIEQAVAAGMFVQEEGE